MVKVFFSKKNKFDKVYGSFRSTMTSSLEQLKSFPDNNVNP